MIAIVLVQHHQLGNQDSDETQYCRPPVKLTAGVSASVPMVLQSPSRFYGYHYADLLPADALSEIRTSPA